MFSEFPKCTILKTCPDLSKYYDTILQTCPDLLKYYDTILQTCPDLSKWFDMILKTCWDLSKTKRWWNTQKFEWMTDKVTHYKAIPRTAFDKRAVKNALNNLILATFIWKLELTVIFECTVVWIACRFYMKFPCNFHLKVFT